MKTKFSISFQKTGVKDVIALIGYHLCLDLIIGNSDSFK